MIIIFSVISFVCGMFASCLLIHQVDKINTIGSINLSDENIINQKVEMRINKFPSKNAKYVILHIVNKS